MLKIIRTSNDWNRSSPAARMVFCCMASLVVTSSVPAHAVQNQLINMVSSTLISLSKQTIAYAKKVRSNRAKSVSGSAG